MSAPKSYDAAVEAVFALNPSGSFTKEFNNRADLELELKKAQVLGFMVVTASGVSTYHPMTAIKTVTVTEI